MNPSDPQEIKYPDKEPDGMSSGRQAPEGESLLLSILDSSLDIIQAFDAVRDQSGTIIDFVWKVQNKRGREQNGDVIGKSLLLHNPGVVTSGIFERMVEVVETGAPSEQEQYYYHEQFDDQWFYQALAKQGDGVTMTTRNITAHKRFNLEMQAAKSRLEAVINVSAIALAKLVAVRDSNGTTVDFVYEWLNDTAVRMNFDGNGKSLLASAPYAADSGLFDLMVKTAETGEMQQKELYYSAAGHEQWLYYKIVKLDDGVMFSCDNITERKQAEQALQEQARLIRAVTDVMPDMMSVVALPSRNIIYANRDALATLGFDGESFTTSYVERTRLFHSEDLPALEAYYERFASLSDEEENKVEYRIKKRNGKWVLLSVRGKVFKRDGEGNVTQVLMIGQDITDRRKSERELLDLKDQVAEKAKGQLKQSESLLASIFKASPIGLGFFDTRGEVVLINDEMRRFLPSGMMPSKDEENVDRWLAFHPDGSRIKPHDYPGARALKGDPVLPFLEMQYFGENADPIWARVSAVPFVDDSGVVLGFISVITDINELKRTTEELMESEQQLKQMLEQKDEFITIASHELKTPVTSIKAYAQLVQANLERSGDAKNGDLLSRLNGQINRLVSLINQLLDLTRVQEGKMELQLEEVNIREMLLEQVEEMAPTTLSTLVLQAGLLPSIKIDRERIRQVVTNLLSNAIKYSSPGTQIIVRTEALEKGIRISVQDQGEGISEKDQQKVFERFFRATDGHTNLAPGMGLGLYISEQIIRRHGGYFSLESKKGAGSVFSFFLPFENTVYLVK
ncbi:ATP-binding protein [Niabella sp. 22666]|uniref:PAS domain-containing sensor histidine kinase n=1 Tax=Niabella sp. 22666 TaxID=3453954 RepID=UPI003F830B54